MTKTRSPLRLAVAAFAVAAVGILGFAGNASATTYGFNAPVLVQQSSPWQVRTEAASLGRPWDFVIVNKAGSQYLKQLVTSAPYKGNGVGAVYGIVQQNVCDREVYLGRITAATGYSCKLSANYLGAQNAIKEASDLGLCWYARVDRYTGQAEFYSTGSYCS